MAGGGGAGSTLLLKLLNHELSHLIRAGSLIPISESAFPAHLSMKGILYLKGVFTTTTIDVAWCNKGNIENEIEIVDF